ncbi:hypothetical protein WEI85_23435 [Actinomycetes bacterium KLBMP 9797]
MFGHPDIVLAQAYDRQRELIEEAHRGRLLDIALRARKARRATKERVRGEPTGTLASCGPRAAAPAQ